MMKNESAHKPMQTKHIDLTGKTAVITGASQGIGKGVAIRLAKAGANVLLLARNEQAVCKVAVEIGELAHAIRTDVSSWPEVESAFALGMQRFGSIDMLINNAGVIDPIARIEVANPEAWGRVIDINLKGVFHGIRAAIPHMKHQGGTIVNLSSGAANGALEGWSHYCSSKAAVLSLTRCVHKEYSHEGIRCVGFSPGTVATHMQKAIAQSGINPVSQLNWSEHSSIDTVAEALIWLCTPASSDYDGTDFSLKAYSERLANE